VRSGCGSAWRLAADPYRELKCVFCCGREHRTIAIRTYSVPDLEESQGLFTSIERICGSTGSCAAHALTWRSRPCMALGEWIEQWLQIVAARP